MQARVTAIVVVRNGGDLDRTHAALSAQTRRPDSAIDGMSYAAAASQVPSPAHDDEWLWLLTSDTAPLPDALAKLLAAVEVARSVAIAGPKVVDAENPRIIRSYGETLTRVGRTVPLVGGEGDAAELDQGQHDWDVDVMGVQETGMLIRRRVWDALGGFDRGLPTTDAGLDLSIRARLAGHRVVRVPGARVARTRPIEDSGRAEPLSPAARVRVARTAQLHRRMVYAPGGAVPIHWLSLVPLGVVRAIGRIIGKQPELTGAELASGFAAAFDGTVPAARSRLARTKSAGWAALASLRMPGDEVRERRIADRERRRAAIAAPGGVEFVRPLFFSQGGIVVVALMLVAGIALGWPLINAQSLGGGSLRALSDSVGDLWGALGWGVRDTSTGALGPANPFTYLLAILGSLTPWNPSFALVLLWLLAPALAALAAWWCATRFTVRPGVVVAVAVLWGIAPPLIAALGGGRPGAVLAHVLLPWVVLLAYEGARSWGAAAAASILFAATVASAPSLAPALVVLAVVWAFVRPRAFPRLIGIVIPAAVLFAPLVAVQVLAGRPLAWLADPGPAATFTAPSGWQLLLGSPTADADGWQAIAAQFHLPAQLGTLAPAVLLAPIAVLALVGPFVPHARRSIAALVIAVLGLGTAIASLHLAVAASGPDPVGPWPGAGLSLYWMGLLGAGIGGLESLRRASAAVGGVAALAGVLALGPAFVTLVVGNAIVQPGAAPLPALVVAQGDLDRGLGTLVLSPTPQGVAADIQRGSGDTLDRSSTLQSTAQLAAPDTDRSALAELAGNLASHSGYDAAPALQQFHVGFVLLPPAPRLGDQAAQAAAAAVRDRASEALDSQAALTPVGDSPSGSLWRTAAPPASSPPSGDPGLSAIILTVQGIVFGFVLLLALPTAPGRRAVRPGFTLPGEDPADTFDEDEDA